MPLVSIVITNYNYSRYLERCLKSCLSQRNFCDYEVILVDDGSADDSLGIVEKFSGDSKLKIIKKSNGGIERASNSGFKAASGQFVVRVDADDWLHESYMENMIVQLDNHTAFFYPDYFLVDEQSNLIGEKQLPDYSKDEIIKRGDFLATGTMLNKEILRSYGFYNERVKNSGLENYELIIKMVLGHYQGKHIGQSLFYYRRHSKNMSEEKRDAIIQYGKILFSNAKLEEYGVNENHPYMPKM